MPVVIYIKKIIFICSQKKYQILFYIILITEITIVSTCTCQDLNFTRIN